MVVDPRSKLLPWCSCLFSLLPEWCICLSLP